jgi:AcrR family transcriptional regulator
MKRLIIPGKPKLRRLSPEQREQQILAKAIQYFATRGFSASTRDLAKEIGVTQPLLYRYFPTKKALVERVFETVYLSPWDVAWETLLVDRSRALRERLHDFYRQYAGVILNREWIRIFIFAGMAGECINDRYLSRLRVRIFDVVLAEIRHEFNIAPPTPQQSEYEIEFIWGLHAAIFYIGVRKWIYGMAMPEDQNMSIAIKVDAFLDSAAAAMNKIRAD